jgi:hypothetical protein
MEIEIPAYIPEAVVQKTDRGSNRLAVAGRDYRRATAPEEKARLMRELALLYSLEVNATGRDMELRILPE